MSNSNEMGGLIPLRLKATDTRRSSPSPPPSIPLPPIPPKSPHRPRPKPVTNLKIFPYTEGDWREVMEEVKTLYLKRQCKQCSARCIQTLESIKDPYRVHPLYQIYFSFFAASSLEITSRSLHLNSSTKLPLLQQSLTYYQNAESHMEYASFSTDPTIVQAVRQSRHNSISSSIRSSIDSIFSHTSSRSSIASSVAPSPTSSLYSSDSTSDPASETTTSTHKRALSAPHPNNTTPALPKPKKKVSFSLQLPRVLSEEELELADDSTILNCFPTPPTSTSPPSPPPSPDSISDFLLSRALIRYRGHLSDLHYQLNYHIKSVEEQIQELQSNRKAWRSNLSHIVTDFAQSIEGVEKEEMKKVELLARVSRLKQSGWKRERFNGRRYQELCDRALGELE